MPEVYAAHLDLAPRNGVEARGAFLESLRAWVGPRWPTDSPWIGLEATEGVRAEDGSVFRWEPYVDGATTLLEFTWRHPHVGDASITWSTQAAFFDVGAGFRLSLRVSNTGPEFGVPRALLTTRPRLTGLLAEKFAIRVDGMNCQLEAKQVQESDFSSFVRYELFDPERGYPLLLLSPQADGQYAMAPDALAREFHTLAKVTFAENPQSTYALTRELGTKALSCFNGALRVYLSGLRRDADPYKHPLITQTHIRTTSERLRLAQFLSARRATLFRASSRFHTLRDERHIAGEAKRKQLLALLHSTRQSSADADTWRGLAESYAKDNSELTARVAALEERLEDSEEKIKALRYSLTERNRVQDNIVESELEFEPSSVLEAVEYAKELFSDSTVILQSALDASADSPYSRPAEVWHALRAIEEIAGRLIAGPLGKNLRDAFMDHGFEYKSGIAVNTPRKLREQYRFEEDGAEYVCEEHLCLGSSSYDPASCLRIYFASGGPPGRPTVIGHVGRHLEGLSTS